MVGLPPQQVDINLSQLKENWIFKKMSESFVLSSLEECLNKYIPAEELKEVKRIIYGQREE